MKRTEISTKNPAIPIQQLYHRLDKLHYKYGVCDDEDEWSPGGKKAPTFIVQSKPAVALLTRRSRKERLECSAQHSHDPMQHPLRSFIYPFLLLQEASSLIPSPHPAFSKFSASRALIEMNIDRFFPPTTTTVLRELRRWPHFVEMKR